MSAGGKALHTIEDIRKLFDEPPIKLSTDGARYLQDVANNMGAGSLRRCKIVLQNGARRARKRQNKGDSETVTVTADDLYYSDTNLRREKGERELINERRRSDAQATGTG